MADRIGLYFKTGGVETGGTNALTGLVTGGTLISSEDAETNPLAFAALDTVCTLYYRNITDDGGTPPTITDEDSGKDTTAAISARMLISDWATATEYSVGNWVTESASFYRCLEQHTSGTFATDLAAGKWVEAAVPIPICATADGEFGSTASLPAATGGYQPVYIKQTARVMAGDYDLSIDAGVTFTTGTRPAQVGTVTLDDSVGRQLTATWTALDPAPSGYVLEWSVHDAASWTAVPDADNTGEVITGLTAGTEYDVRVRAWDATGYGAYSATASGTASYWWSDLFSGESLDTNLWRTSFAGTSSVAVATGALTVTHPSTTANYGVVAGLTPIKPSVASKLVINGLDTSANTVQTQYALNSDEDAVYSDYPTAQVALLFQEGHVSEANTAIFLRYYNTSNTAYYWNPTTNQWTTTATGASISAKKDEAYEVEVEFNPTAETVSIHCHYIDTDSAPQTETCTAISYASIREFTGDLWLYLRKSPTEAAAVTQICEGITYGAV